MTAPHSRLIRTAKNAVVPRGRAPRTVLSGTFAGLRLNLDLRVHTQVYFGLWERELTRYLRACAPGVKTAIDVGASEGWYSVFLSSTARDARVIAVEPDINARNHLAQNAALNNRAIEVIAKSAGAYDGREMMTLDSLLPIPLPCLVKIDVEGEELSVLRGAERLLRTPGVGWILEVHSSDLEQDCVALIESAGLRVETVHKAWWRSVLAEHRPLEVNHWLVASRPPAD